MVDTKTWHTTELTCEPTITKVGDETVEHGPGDHFPDKTRICRLHCTMIIHGERYIFFWSMYWTQCVKYGFRSVLMQSENLAQLVH